mmetsp:Transcript_26301/g.69114  ORF Transcript_26301/g.69114 Transcript_26301/m.69114 type:complete len:203 (+) Transcript_26301:242-850(+)
MASSWLGLGPAPPAASEWHCSQAMMASLRCTLQRVTSVTLRRKWNGSTMARESPRLATGMATATTPFWRAQTTGTKCHRSIAIPTRLISLMWPSSSKRRRRSRSERTDRRRTKVTARGLLAPTFPAGARTVAMVVESRPATTTRSSRERRSSPGGGHSVATGLTMAALNLSGGQPVTRWCDGAWTVPSAAAMPHTDLPTPFV